MARIRTIKPDFWTDEKIAELPVESRLIYIATWNYADDIGVLKGSIKLLKSQILPYDYEIGLDTFSKWMDHLIQSRMLIPFEHKNEKYIYIRNFSQHQKIDKPSKPLIPKEELEQILIVVEHSSNSRGIVVPVNSNSKEEKEMEKYMEVEAENFATPTALTEPSKKKDEDLKLEAFNIFWDLYDKKVGDKQKLQKKWLKLSLDEIAAIGRHVPKYVAAAPDKKFRKNPETYLNNKSWNDEIIESNNTNNGTTQNNNNNKFAEMQQRRNEVDDLAKRSAEFLQKFIGQNVQ